MARPRFQSPKGTRDLYPEDMLRRRYITQAWRDTSIRHGFEEVDGPTFESSELYAVKSGDGILGELFQAFSGKDPKDLEFIKEHDRAQLALRPEFTPTLARLYAARAAQLPKPTKWFSIGPFFRAERPQRGRLREFLQWNADVIGTDANEKSTADADSELIATAVDCLRAFRFTPYMQACGESVIVHYSDRRYFEELLKTAGIRPDSVSATLALADRATKIPLERFLESWIGFGGNSALGKNYHRYLKHAFTVEVMDSALVDALGHELPCPSPQLQLHGQHLSKCNKDRGLFDATHRNIGIVRGLAYYTGTVFEVIAEGERAVAGGGRYDNLIELLGGPPTPAVGFAMGDVVLSLLLEDKNLMPEGRDLLEACGRPAASLRPEAFVVTGDDSLDPAVRRLVADLRRGTERDGFDGTPWAADRYATRPLHARRTYKSTRNIGKLVKDANAQHAKALVIIETEEHATVQDLDRTGALDNDKLERVPLADVPATIARLTA